MRVGIDLHKTLDHDVKHGGQLKLLMQGLIKAGEEVWIISGGPTIKEIVNVLNGLNILKDIHYTRIICVVDFLKEKGTTFTYDENGNPWCDDDSWWKSKAAIMSENDIDVLFDDKKEYAKYIPSSKFIYYPDWEIIAKVQKKLMQEGDKDVSD